MCKLSKNIWHFPRPSETFLRPYGTFLRRYNILPRSSDTPLRPSDTFSRPSDTFPKLYDTFPTPYDTFLRPSDTFFRQSDHDTFQRPSDTFQIPEENKTLKNHLKKIYTKKFKEATFFALIQKRDWGEKCKNMKYKNSLEMADYLWHNRQLFVQDQKNISQKRSMTNPI